jgi:lipoprotein-anchoring transpeptidase ErfK/SrfK
MKPTETRSRTHTARASILLTLTLITRASALAQAAATSKEAATEPRIQRHILVSIPDRKLAVLEGGKVIRVFPVAVGAAVSPSPTGGFQIVRRLVNPTYYHPGVVIPPGSDNPIGPRWVGLNKKGYGIHGTNEPRSIGKAASHGCIRMRNRDIVQFFSMVNVGDAVEILGERDQQIAQVFGAEVDTPASSIAQAANTGAEAGGGQ